VFGLIEKAREKEREGRMWEEYLSIRPNMTQENFMTYSDFKDKLYINPVKRSNKSKDDIIKNAQRIAQKDRKGA
jgi:hypothetical protein